MSIKKAFAVLLAVLFAMQLSTASFATAPADFNQPNAAEDSADANPLTPSDVIDAAEEIELTQAEKFGLPTEKVGRRTISGREFMELADAFVSFAAPEKLSEWKNEFSVFREVDDPIYRADAMVVIYYAGLTIGGKYAEIYTDYSNEMAFLRTDQTIDPGDYCHTDLLDGYAVTHGPEGDGWGVGAAVEYNLNHWSPISGRCPFYHNPDNNSFDFDILPCYADCVLAIIRVIASGNPELFDDLFPKNVRDPGIFNDEINEKMALYPEITVDNMPQWTGHIIYTEGTFYSDMVQYVRDVKEWGFNGIRVRIDLTRAMDEKVEHLNNNLYLLVLDQMIAEAIKLGIHFELTCNYAPGRWFKTMPSGNYMTSVIFDHLYGDKYYQDLTDELWRTLTERYKGIPNACLTIMPLQEMCYTEHGNGFLNEENTDWIEYTPQDVANYQAHLIDVMHEVDPDRIVLFEADNRDYNFDLYGQPVIDAIKGKPNTAIAHNFPGTGGWLYVDMNFDKPDVDNYHHSMPVARYPYCGYEAHELITHDCPIKIGGFLPADTKITLNLRKFEMGDGDFMPDGATLRILADGEELYSEYLTPTEYATGEVLSGHMPYAESEKQITVTLQKDTDSVIMDFGSDVDYNVDDNTIWDSMIRLYWSGIKVHLPEKYAVNQLWNATDYDISLGIADVDEPGIYVKPTSDILIGPLMGPYADNFSTHDITIYDNVTYSTPYEIEKTSRETNTEFINILTDRCEGFGYRSFRWESPFGYGGKVWEDVKNYLIDTLDAMTANGLSWCIFFGLQSHWATNHVYGIEPTSYGRYKVYYPQVLEILQKYMAPGWCEFSAGAEGQGSVSGSQMLIAGGSATLTATPDDGAEFLGWYLDGALVSDNPVYTATVTADTRLVAKFTPDAILGDLNSDGEVTVKDGVLMQRVLAELETDPKILALADLNADGEITVKDGVKMQRILAKLE